MLTRSTYAPTNQERLAAWYAKAALAGLLQGNAMFKFKWRKSRQEISMEYDPGPPAERNMDDEFPDVTDPRDPDLPAPEGWQLPAREIRF